MKILGTYNDLSKSLKRNFDIAKAACNYANAPYGKRIGSALFSSGKLLSIGWNTFGQSHTLYSGIRNKDNFDRCIHSEWLCLLHRQYYEDSNLILYIYRERKDNTIACAKPCSICMTLIKIANVKRIRYSSNNNMFVEEKV